MDAGQNISDTRLVRVSILQCRDTSGLVLTRRKLGSFRGRRNQVSRPARQPSSPRKDGLSSWTGSPPRGWSTRRFGSDRAFLDDFADAGSTMNL